MVKPAFSSATTATAPAGVSTPKATKPKAPPSPPPKPAPLEDRYRAANNAQIEGGEKTIALVYAGPVYEAYGSGAEYVHRVLGLPKSKLRIGEDSEVTVSPIPTTKLADCRAKLLSAGFKVVVVESIDRPPKGAEVQRVVGQGSLTTEAANGSPSAPKRKQAKASTPNANGDEAANGQAPKRAAKKSAKRGPGASSASPSASSSPSPSSQKGRSAASLKVVYPEKSAVLFEKGTKKGPLTVEIMKELLGWEEETEQAKFGSDYLFKDKNNNKVRLTNNTNNRPFDPATATEWAMEILRDKWRVNGETMIFDRYGRVQSGQHRGVGLIFAWQMNEREPGRWERWTSEEPYMESFVIFGISADDEVINTIDTGKPRSLSDVIFRSSLFSDLDMRARARVAGDTAWAVKMLWRRVNADREAYMPRRSHSEAVDFLMRHPRLLDAVLHIYAEDDKGKLFSRISPVPVSNASALLYLMGCSASDYSAYVDTNDESALDWSMWDKACDFFVDLAGDGAATKPLREALKEIDREQMLLAKQEALGTIVKAWLLFAEDEPITADDIHVLMTVDELDRPILAERPCVGGIDRFDAVVEAEE